MNEFSALGKKVTEFSGFDTFPAPQFCTEVEAESDEVTAVCPVTGQPDWYKITVNYRPDKLCVESKTLKLYFQSFRNEGVFCEALSTRIAQDLFEALQPKSITVTVLQKPRGGIAIKGVSTLCAS